MDKFESKLKRTLIYHSASCYLLFLLHPLPSLGIMIKQRSSKISCGQRSLYAPSFASTSSNLLLAVSVRTIVIEVGSDCHFFENVVLPWKLIMQEQNIWGKASCCSASAVVLNSLTVLRGRKRHSQGIVSSFHKLHFPKMGPSGCLDSISAEHLCFFFMSIIQSSTTHILSFILKP